MTAIFYAEDVVTDKVIQNELRRAYKQLSEVPGSSGDRLTRLFWLQNAQRVLGKTHSVIRRVLKNQAFLGPDSLNLKQLRVVCQRYAALEQMVYNHLHEFNRRHSRSIPVQAQTELSLLLVVAERKDGLCSVEAKKHLDTLVEFLYRSSTPKTSGADSVAWQKAYTENMEAWLDAKLTPNKTLKGWETLGFHVISDPNSRRFGR